MAAAVAVPEVDVVPLDPHVAVAIAAYDPQADVNAGKPTKPHRPATLKIWIEKSVKNRWHWDVVGEDVDELVRRGATLLRRPDDDIDWHVLADPAGNEFCVFGP